MIGLDAPIDVPFVPECIASDASLAITLEGYLEGAIWAEDVAINTLWEDALQETLLLQHLVCRRCCCLDHGDGGRGGHGGGQEEEMVLGHVWYLGCHMEVHILGPR